MKPRLHLLGLPHTITTDEFSHCAFTGKVKKFSPMMRSVGYTVIHYGVEGAESGADTQVSVMSQDHWMGLCKKTRQDDPKLEQNPTSRSFVGDLANVGNRLYKEFNARLAALLMDHLAPHDIICLPFGHAHQDAADFFPKHSKVETGIGYPITFTDKLVFESYAWQHWHYGQKKETKGSDYHWVIPNYFDISQWTFSAKPGEYLLYFGRIIESKGLNEIREIAKARPDLRVLLCGQGDPTPWLVYKNIEYVEPVHGKARSDILGGALAVLMPTRFIEPFGGVTVEANLCGTPVIASPFGSFTETIVQGLNGYRCHTLGDYLAAIERIEAGVLERHAIRNHAMRYDLLKLAHDYDAVFQQVGDLWQEGWFTRRSVIGPITKSQ